MSRLRQALADYLMVRRALGYKLERAGRLLAQFLTYVEDVVADTVTTEHALAWATGVNAASAGGGVAPSPRRWPSSGPNALPDRWFVYSAARRAARNRSTTSGARPVASKPSPASQRLTCASNRSWTAADTGV